MHAMHAMMCWCQLYKTPHRMEVNLYCSDQVRPLKFQCLQCDYLKKVHNVLFIYLDMSFYL